MKAFLIVCMCVCRRSKDISVVAVVSCCWSLLVDNAVYGATKELADDDRLILSNDVHTHTHTHKKQKAKRSSKREKIIFFFKFKNREK